MSLLTDTAPQLQSDTAAQPRASWLYTVAFMPLALAIFWAFVDVRPYFYHEYDTEHDSYYNARLAALNQPVVTCHHPATPIYYGGAALMRLVGTDLSKTQAFLNTCYLAEGCLFAAALWLFVRLLRPYYEPFLLLLATASATAWSSALTHLNYFGADAFLAIFGLFAVTCFWLALHRATAFRRWLVLCGVGTGLCLATKLSALPLALALGVGITTHVLRRMRAGALGAAWLLAFPLVTASTFVLLILPVIWRLAPLISITVGRKETSVWGVTPAGVVNLLERLIAGNGALLVVATCCLILAAVGIVSGRFRECNKSQSPGSEQEPSAPYRFDGVSGGLFVAILTLGLVYTVIAAGRAVEPLGFQIRNTTSCALVFPPLILFAGNYWRGPSQLPQRLWRAIAISATLLIVGQAVVYHAITRHLRVRTLRLEADGVLAALEHRNSNGGRIALWDGSPGSLGELSFHFWGNSRYAGEAFNEELLQRFNGWTPLRLRHVVSAFNTAAPPTEAKAGVEAQTEPQTASKGGSVGSWLWAMYRAHRPNNRHYEQGSLYVGQRSGLRVGLIALPYEEWRVESRSADVELLAREVRQRLGLCTVERQQLGKDDWILIHVRTAEISH